MVNAVELCHPREDRPLVLQTLHCMKFCLTSAAASYDIDERVGPPIPRWLNERLWAYSW